MSDKYKIHDNEKAYFVTMTVSDWVDVFTKKRYRLMVVESLKYCQKFKGLEIYCWVLMSNHLHVIVKATADFKLWEILRDFKKFTARAILNQITEGSESRKEWMLKRFEYNARFKKRVERYKFWQDGNHAEQIQSSAMFYQKLQYIHNNPVREMIVKNPEDYLFSSARNYAGLDSVLEVVVETPQLKTIS